MGIVRSSSVQQSMAGLPKSHRLMVGLALALLVAPAGGADLGFVDVDGAAERSLASRYSDADDSTAGPRNEEDQLEACGLGSRARMYSDGMEDQVALSEVVCKGGRRSPSFWMLPEPEEAGQLRKAEAPVPYSSAGDVTAAAGLAWTGLGLLLSSSGLFMAWRRRYN